MRRRRDISYSCAGGRTIRSWAGIWRKSHALGLGKKPLKKVTDPSYSLFNRRLSMADQITYDKAYDAVAPGDFPAMLQVPRYGRRSDAFDAIISATHDHFWDPLDVNYIDYDMPFDMVRQPIMPLDNILELKSAVADRLDDGQKIALANDVTHWSISNLLHGEQGALSLSASLCHVLRSEERR